MRIVKILLASVAVLVVLAVGGVAFIASTFDPNEYKGVATDAFTARTGRTLSIEEDLRLDYFPWVAIETGGVTVGNAAEFGQQPFATARHVAARVKLMPLLSRRVEIGTVVLDGLTLNLARDAELRGNWEDFLESSEPDPAPQASGEDGAFSIDSLAIEGVRITDGNVYWHENANELRYSVTALALTTGGIGSVTTASGSTALPVLFSVRHTRAGRRSGTLSGASQINASAARNSGPRSSTQKLAHALGVTTR